MSLIEDAKKTCPSCSSQTLRKATMNEEGVSIPVDICSSCGWWG